MMATPLLQPGAVVAWADEHPALRDIDPTLFQIQRRTHLRSLSNRPLATLLTSDSGPLIVESRGEGQPSGGRLMYWLFDLDETDLPSRMGFPVMVWNTLDYLAGRDVAASRAMLLTGEPLRLEEAQTPPQVFGPTGEPLAVSRDAAGWRCDQTQKQGIYRTSGPNAALAVNLLSGRGAEPLPGRDEADAMPSPPTELKLSALDAPLNWRTVLIGLLVLGLIEWFVFSRRWIRLG